MHIITQRLITWYTTNQRDLPWRKTKDPFKIWISEVILQQTRVAQGMNYYSAFVNHFDKVEQMAAADEQDILNLWKGLGYYSRARNMHKAARQIMTEFDGRFPDNYNDLLKLSGVGTYTAAAIASFAFDERTTVLDGNVFRLIARLFDLDIPIDVEKNKVFFLDILKELLGNASSSEFNQAVMEFGALQCLPFNPDCGNCVLNEHCLALKNKTVNVRPVKLKRVKVKKRYFSYVWITYKDSVLLRKRVNKDIWQGLYEPFLIESSKALKTVEQVLEHSPNLRKLGKDLVYATSFKHILTHQQLFADFFLLELTNLENDLSLEVISLDKLTEIPFSRLTEKFLEFMKIDG